MHILHPNVSECFLWISNYSFLPGKAIFDQGCSGWLVVGGWIRFSKIGWIRIWSEPQGNTVLKYQLLACRQKKLECEF